MIEIKPYSLLQLTWLAANILGHYGEQPMSAEAALEVVIQNAFNAYYPKRYAVENSRA